MNNTFYFLLFLSSFCYSQEGAIDTTFDYSLYAYSYNMSRMAIQPDNKIVIVRYINFSDPLELIRLNADGTLDQSFSGTILDSYSSNLTGVPSIAIQNDGKILIAGTNLGGDIIRLNTDGSLDSIFETNYSVIKGLHILSSGKILVAAKYFLDSVIFRYNVDGTLDPTFTLTNTPGPGAHIFAEQSDGKVIVSYGGAVQRIKANGGLDFSWPINYSISTKSIVVQSDDKVVIAGFNNYPDIGDIIRLNANGIADPTFPTIHLELGGYFNCAYLFGNSIIVGGDFTTINGIACRTLERILVDGTIDPDFNPGAIGANGPINQVLPQSDNKLIVGGGFSTYNTINVHSLVRLNAVTLQRYDFENAEISIFPNPTSDFFSIHSEIQPDKVEIYDITGRFISNSHNLSTQKAGVYLVKAFFMDRFVIKKIIKL